MTLLRFTAIAMIACILAAGCKKHDTVAPVPVIPSAPAHYNEVAGMHTFQHQYAGIYAVYPQNYPVYTLVDTSLSIITLGDTAVFLYNDTLLYKSSTDSTLQFELRFPYGPYKATFSYNFLTHYMAYRNSKYWGAALGSEYNYLRTR
jgi:hypothetical protein